MERSDRIPRDVERPRTFFAVEPDDAARTAVAALLRGLVAGADEVRWVKAEQLHVTLRFLGEIAADRIDGLVRQTASEVARVLPFSLRIGGIMPFPGPRRPRVVALEVAPAARLETLFAAVERGVAAAGFARESRAYHPHLTLGRIRRGGHFPDVTGADTPRRQTFDVSEAVLFRSDLGPGGARYTPLARLPLGTARAA